MQAFGISEEDLANVLRKHWARVANTNGLDFEAMADLNFRYLNDAAVEKAALDGGVEMDDQTEAAYEEIERQMVALGVLEPVCA